MMHFASIKTSGQLSTTSRSCAFDIKLDNEWTCIRDGGNQSVEPLCRRSVAFRDLITPGAIA